MANDLDFADFREPADAFAAVIFAERLRGIDARDVERRQFKGALAWRRLLENQAFVLIGVARCFLDSAIQVSVPVFAEQPFLAVLVPNLVVRYVKSSRASRGHKRECLCYNGFSSAVFTALANFSMSERVVVSVTQTSACFVSSG